MSNTANVTPDDVLSEQENQRLSEMIAIKKHVYAFLNKEKLVEFILHIIDSSGVVSFERKHDRRFLKLENLSMALLLDLEAAAAKFEMEDLFEANNSFGREKTMTARANLLRELIVVPFTDMMSNILNTIIDQGPTEEYVHHDWLLQILPENFRELRKSVNNFRELSKEEKEQMKKDFKFMFGMASAFVFPPEDVNLNEDPGFTIEFLL